jgi:hypothetical protein
MSLRPYERLEPAHLGGVAEVDRSEIDADPIGDAWHSRGGKCFC